MGYVKKSKPIQLVAKALQYTLCAFWLPCLEERAPYASYVYGSARGWGSWKVPETTLPDRNKVCMILLCLLQSLLVQCRPHWLLHKWCTRRQGIWFEVIHEVGTGTPTSAML